MLDTFQVSVLHTKVEKHQSKADVEHGPNATGLQKPGFIFF